MVQHRILTHPEDNKLDTGQTRKYIEEHRAEAKKLLDRGMFHMAMHEIRICVDLANSINQVP